MRTDLVATATQADTEVMERLGALSQVLCVENCAAALTMLKELRPALFLLDYHLPDMNGLAVPHATRASGEQL